MSKIKPRVLVIDDHEYFLQDIKKGLERYDFKVDILSDNTKTLETLSKRKYDLILLDLGSASLDIESYELADTITKNYPQTPLFGQTSWADLTHVREARNHFDAILSKQESTALAREIAGLYEYRLPINSIN